MVDSENDENQNRRPVPVRLVMDATNGQETEAESSVQTLQDPVSGEEWFARVSGRSTGGVLPLRSIPLMDVIFFKEGEETSPQRQVLWQGQSLDDLGEGDLLLLFQASKPLATPKSDDPPQDKARRKNRPRRGG